MEYFDVNESVDSLEKKLVEESYKKQSKYAKKVLTITFGIMGGVFALIGLVLFVVFLLCVNEILAWSVGFALFGMGLLFLMLIPLFRLMPETINYERYKRRTKRYGSLSYYEMNVRIEVLERKNEILETKIKSLEDKIRRM